VNQGVGRHGLGDGDNVAIVDCDQSEPKIAFPIIVIITAVIGYWGGKRYPEYFQQSRNLRTRVKGVLRL
jgi:hypothetical protein